MPPNITRTFEDFLKNYLFHIILALFLSLKLKEKPEFYKSPYFYFPPAVTCLVVSLHHLYSGITLCLVNNHCPSTIFISDDISLLKGVVNTPSAFVFIFFLFLSLSFEKNRFRYFFIFTSLLALFMQILLGRRSSLLSIIISTLILGVLSKHRFIKTVGLFIGLALSLAIAILLTIPEGKNLLIRSDKINLLLQGRYAEAGSLGKRIYMWQIYLKTASQNPFSGTGIGWKTQKLSLPKTNELGLNLGNPHNTFLNIWLQAGIHNLIIFLTICFYTILKAYKMWCLKPEKPIYGFLLGYIFAFLIISFFFGTDEGTRFTPFWITCGLIWGLNEKNSLSS